MPFHAQEILDQEAEGASKIFLLTILFLVAVIIMIWIYIHGAAQ